MNGLLGFAVGFGVGAIFSKKRRSKRKAPFWVSQWLIATTRYHNQVLYHDEQHHGWSKWGTVFASREEAEARLLWLCAKDPTLLCEAEIEEKKVLKFRRKKAVSPSDTAL
jgi:hypothetical protein